jgi:glycosyltransferase involved in cell wall biosynthesis
MRLLLLNWRDPKNPDAGGAEQFTHQILKRLVTRGINVTQISAGFDGCEKEEEIEGVRIIRVGRKYSVYHEAKMYYLKSNERFDVIVDEINTLPFMIHSYAKHDERVFILIHQLAREFWYYETPFPVNTIGYHFLEDHWLKKCKEIPTITVSKSTRDDLINLGYKDVKIIHEGFDHEPLSEVPKKESDPTVIFVGRFKKAKRPDHALEAFIIAKKSIPNLHLWMIGDGYIRKELEERGIPDVEFFGKINTEDKNTLISKAHLLIVPAVREGWGLVVTESNAMGTPALGYDVGGLRDSIKDGRTGILCKPNIESMAEKIVSIFNDKTELSNLATNALNDSRQYNWDRSTDEFYSIISESELK